MGSFKDAWRIVLIGIGIIVVVAACGGVKLGQLASRNQPAAGNADSLSMSLHTVPTVRSVTVTPRRAVFGDCSGGTPVNNTPSTKHALGFPNGTCWVGKPGTDGKFPVTVTNTGIAANIEVSGADAVPSDDGTSWSLCNPGPHPAAACSSHNGQLPGLNQYAIQNFAPNQKVNTAGLANQLACDPTFGSKDHCWATFGHFRDEGLELIGPMESADASTHWHITITWTPVP
ncbi:MAG: hypothetical protein ABJB47_10720 [Actinomycetota bacterium]